MLRRARPQWPHSPRAGDGNKRIRCRISTTINENELPERFRPVFKIAPKDLWRRRADALADQRDDQDGHGRSARPKATNMTTPAIIPTSSAEQNTRMRELTPWRALLATSASLTLPDGFCSIGDGLQGRWALATDCVIALIQEHCHRPLFAIESLLNRKELERIGARAFPKIRKKHTVDGGRDRDRTCDPYHVNGGAP